LQARVQLRIAPEQFIKLKGKLVSLDMEKLATPVGKPVAIEIVGNDYEYMRKIGSEYKDIIMAKVPGVIDISDDYMPEKMRFELKLMKVLLQEPMFSLSNSNT
jgi:Cu/Ag efflux pump CusA